MIALFRRMGKNEPALPAAPGKPSPRKSPLTAPASEVARALTAAWWAFRKAASDDTAGWEMARATAEVRPEEPLTWRPKTPVCETVPGEA